MSELEKPIPSPEQESGSKRSEEEILDLELGEQKELERLKLALDTNLGWLASSPKNDSARENVRIDKLQLENEGIKLKILEEFKSVSVEDISAALSQKEKELQEARDSRKGPEPPDQIVDPKAPMLEQLRALHKYMQAADEFHVKVRRLEQEIEILKWLGGENNVATTLHFKRSGMQSVGQKPKTNN